jgi:hypothetical protein
MPVRRGGGQNHWNIAANRIPTVFLFLAFAAIVWAGIYIHRRTWWALVWWLCAVATLITVAMFHSWLNVFFRGTIYMPVMRTVLYPYAVLVVGLGLILALMPKRYPGRPCPKCKYDVTGLAEEGRFSCPECNSVHAFEYEGEDACRVCGTKLSGLYRTPDIQCWRCNALYVVNADLRGFTACDRGVSRLSISELRRSWRTFQ